MNGPKALDVLKKARAEFADLAGQIDDEGRRVRKLRLIGDALQLFARTLTDAINALEEVAPEGGAR